MTRLDATTTGGDLATMATDSSGSPTTTSGDLHDATDATMATVGSDTTDSERSDATTDTNRRRGDAASIIAATKTGKRDATLRHISATRGVAPPTTVNKPRHRANYRSNGANR